MYNISDILFIFFPNSNDFGPCKKRVTNAVAATGAIDITATIHAAKFAIQQAHKLNIPKLRIYTDCNNLFDAINGDIEMWKANGWLNPNNEQPLQNRADYEELDDVMRCVPIDIDFELLAAHSENDHQKEALRQALRIDDWYNSKLTLEETQYCVFVLGKSYPSYCYIHRK